MLLFSLLHILAPYLDSLFGSRRDELKQYFALRTSCATFYSMVLVQVRVDKYCDASFFITIAGVDRMRPVYYPLPKQPRSLMLWEDQSFEEVLAWCKGKFKHVSGASAVSVGVQPVPKCMAVAPRTPEPPSPGTPTSPVFCAVLVQRNREYFPLIHLAGQQTVADVKAEIFKKHHIQEYEQELFFLNSLTGQKDYLEDNVSIKALDGYNIGMVGLHLLVWFDLMICKLGGDDRFFVRMNDILSVRYLKITIYEETGIPIAQQSLVHGTEVLVEGTMSENGIKSNSDIYLILNALEEC